MDTERLPPAIGVNMPLLDKGSSSVPGARTPPPTFEDPEDGTELQVLVAGGSDAAPAPAPALQAEAPAACGLQPRAEASAPLSGLQQVSDTSAWVWLPRKPGPEHVLGAGLRVKC